MNYVDQYGRYHHKEVTATNPVPSNNGFLYTAYASKVGLRLRIGDLTNCYIKCNNSGVLYRSPGKSTPPISRDEILGLTELKLLDISKFDWNFSPYAIPRFNPISFCKQLWQLRPTLFMDERVNGRTIYWSFIPKHRNYFWQNNLDQLYRFAFSVPLTDRHFILKKWGKFRWYKPSHIFYAAIAKIDSKLGKSSGIRFLKHGGEKNGIAMTKEFPKDHPIYRKFWNV